MKNLDWSNYLELNKMIKEMKLDSELLFPILTI